MNTRVINTDAYHLHISPFWNDKGNAIRITVTVSEKEMLEFFIKSKEMLMRILIILQDPTAGSLKELTRLSTDIDLKLWDDGKNLADNEEKVGISEGLGFLNKFKSINLWDHLRATGYHELLPEK